MTQKVVRTVKFTKVLVALIASGVALLIATVIEDRSQISSQNLFLTNTAHADAPPVDPPPDSSCSDSDCGC